MKRTITLLMALILSIGVWAQLTPNVTPLNEGFEQGIPEDWTTIHVSGTIQGNDVVWTTVAGGYNSSSYAAHLYYAQPSGENYLITPQLLPSEGSNNLSFYLYAGNYASDGTTTTLTVEVSTTGVAATDFSNVVYTTTMETFTEYTAVNVDLSAYNGQQIYVAFHVVDQYGSEVFLDDVSGVNILLPACIRPQDLTFSNITETSASLTWTGNATSYVVSYKPSTSETWTDETVTTNSYSFTNLDHSTAYEVKVMGDCGEDGTSAVTTSSFRTVCSAISSFPYVEDFESLSESDFGCWTVEADETSADATKNWVVYESSQYAPNGSKFAYMPYNDGAISRLISPTFDLSSLTSPYVTFYYQTREYQGHTDLMSVFYKTASSTDWTELVAYTTGQSSVVYQEIPLPVATTQIMFVGYAHDGDGVFVDDITIKNIVCPTPSDVAVSDIENHAVTVSWQAAEDVTSFSIQYKLDGDEDWTTVEATNITSPYTLTNLLADTNYFVRVGAVCTEGTTWTNGTLFRTDVPCPTPVISFSNITETSATVSWTSNASSFTIRSREANSEEWSEQTLTANTISLQGLVNSTLYEVEVVADCGEDGTSEVASATFKTLCPEFSDFPYVEDFESLSENDFGCWIIEADETSANASANWTIYDNAQYAPNGSKFAYMPYNDGAISRMISRKFNLSSLTAPYLTFNYQTRTYDGNTDLMSVFYKTADSEEWIELIAYTTGQTSTTYQEISLPATATQIMFVGYAHDGGGVILDDISIKNVLCPTPTDVAVNDITKHGATVSWQAAEDVNSFSVQYKLEADEDWTTVETENPTSPYTLTNLLADTNYLVRVASVCTEGTSWTQAVSFRTDVACPAPVVSDTNNTETSVKIFWTETADSYTFRYRPYGENEWTAEETLTETSRILTELLPSTVYEVEVVANCGEEDGTSLPSTITFRTLCSTISSFPYEETFDTDLGCWTTENVSGQYTWVWANDQTFGPVAIRPYAVGQSLLVSPVFDMSALTSPALSFTFQNPEYENITDTLGVYYKTNANEDWQYLASYSDSHTEMTSVTLSLPTPSQTYQIMFLGEGLDGNRVVLDNIKVFDEDDVSINDVEATTSIRLYPNPTTDNVILNVEGMMNEATVTVSDIQGRNVLTQKLSQGQKTLTIETANLQAGFYYVRVIGNNSVLTQKLIKK